mmetsp:Transcript_27668/g.86057  ORF Transcript_27668/g.86057 Transcript_27668/m.86057 type:complete len:255 (-) Transcript_27668:369-1133(-)
MPSKARHQRSKCQNQMCQSKERRSAHCLVRLSNHCSASSEQSWSLSKEVWLRTATSAGKTSSAAVGNCSGRLPNASWCLTSLLSEKLPASKSATAARVQGCCYRTKAAPKPPAPFSWLSARSTGPGPLGGGRREGRLSRRALRCASCCARSSPMHRSCSSHSSRALSMARRWMACLRRRCSAAGAADGGASAESVPLTPRRTASAFGASLCSRGPEPCSSNLSWMALRFAASSPTHLFKSSTRARSRCRASSSA